MIRDWPALEQRIRLAMLERPEDARLRFGLGEARLAQGDYAEGFRLLLNWHDVPVLRAEADMEFPIPRWRGESLEGRRFLICSNAGLGDQIMFARFAPMLQQLGASVDWLCPEPLVRLFDRCLGVKVIPGVGRVHLGRYDYFSPSGDLGSLFFPPLTVPDGTAYLRAPIPSTFPGLTVGVVTHGNPAHANDGFRSIPPNLREHLLSLPGAVDLKPENTGARDFYDTAQIVAGLDLVVTVDTSVAHLAGAMGKPVWILLAAESTDWRWMSERTDSPWYSSARLFRQGADCDWRPVLDRVRSALGHFEGQRSQGTMPPGVAGRKSAESDMPTTEPKPARA